MNTQTVVFEQGNKQVIQEGSKFFNRIFIDGETFESQDYNTLEKAKSYLITYTVEEDNKIIAKFMGFNIDKRNPNTILYHSDWNWLMEVVEKIESKGFDVFINTCVCRISDVGEDRFEDIETFNSNNKIQAVYSAVVEFINWYNTQQTK